MPIRGVALSIQYTAWDNGALAPKTGDVANHTLRVIKDGVLTVPTNTPTEIDATLVPGEYNLNLTSTEMLADAVTVAGKSATSNVVIIPRKLLTEHGVLPTVQQGSAGALLTSGTGTAQLNVSGGNVAGSVASVAGAVGSVTGAVGSVTGNVGGSVASVTGAVGSVTGNVGGNVTGTVASVLGDVAGKILGGGAGTITGTGARVVDASGNNVAPASTALSTATWTSALAGYLNFLNVGGPVATQADVLTINAGASRRVQLTSSQSFVRPSAGSVTYIVELRTYDTGGNLVAADATPTITATGIISGNLNSHVGAVSNPSTGIYRANYTVNSTDIVEQVRLDSSATLSTVVFPATFYTQVSDAAAVDFTAGDRAKLDALHDTKVPLIDTNVANIQTRLPAALTGDGNLKADALKLNGGPVPANFSAFSLTVGGAVTVGDKTGFALTSAYDPAKTAAAAGAAMSLTVGERTALTNAALDVADAVETGYTLRQLGRDLGAFATGEVAGAGSGTEVFKAAKNPTVTRLVYTVDSAGNRTIVDHQ